jgi:hypothetical protein
MIGILGRFLGKKYVFRLLVYLKGLLDGEARAAAGGRAASGGERGIGTRSGAGDGADFLILATKTRK